MAGKTVMFISVVLASATSAYGQQPHSLQIVPLRFWVTGGMDIGSLDGEAVPGVRISLSGGRTWLFQLAYQNHAEGIFGIFDEAPSQEVVSLAVGRGNTSRSGIAAIFAGPALAWGESAAGRQYTKIGATVNGQLHLRPLSFVRVLSFIGGGVGLSITWIPGEVYAGASLSFSIGNGR